MATTDDKQHLHQWELGMCRVFSASWAASYLSYGLTVDEIIVLAEYYRLLSSCLADIASTIRRG